jgi:hypothetical protein
MAPSKSKAKLYALRIHVGQVGGGVSVSALHIGSFDACKSRLETARQALVSVGYVWHIGAPSLCMMERGEGRDNDHIQFTIGEP